MATKTPAKPVPSVHDDEKYIASFNRLQTIARELAGIEPEILAEEGRYAASVRAARNTNAAELIASGQEPPAPPDVPKSLEQLRERYRILGEAKKLLEKKIADLSLAINEQVAERIRPQHDALVSKVIAALETLVDATEAEAAFVADLVERGFQPHYLFRVILPSARREFFDQVVREARRRGVGL